MAQKNCPVCQLQQPDTSTLCDQCGWDFPIYLGSLEDAQKLGTRRLKEARAVWQETQERRQLRQSVQELQEKLAGSKENCVRLQSQVSGLNERIANLELELKQAKSLNQKQKQQFADAEKSRSQLKQKLRRLQQIVQKSQPPYTKIGHGGVELSDDDTQTQGWMMTRDERTGLIWEIKNSANKDKKYNWEDAQSVFIKKLNTERFGGFSDWRLPTKDELRSIVDRKNDDPAINTEYFPNTTLWYWSSTTSEFNTSYAWVVYFSYGNDNYYVKTDSSYVRAVRGGQ